MYAAFRVALLGCLTAVAIHAAAQQYPAKTITLVVPFPPGGTTDVVARTIAQKLNEAWKQPVVVDNRPGAGATIGATQVAKSNPDGYTLLMGAVHHTIATSIYTSLPYDFQKDLAPVTTVALVQPKDARRVIVTWSRRTPGAVVIVMKRSLAFAEVKPHFISKSYSPGMQ